jgi:hypothetical protein
MDARLLAIIVNRDHGTRMSIFIQMSNKSPCRYFVIRGSHFSPCLLAIMIIMIDYDNQTLLSVLRQMSREGRESLFRYCEIRRSHFSVFLSVGNLVLGAVRVQTI